MDADGYKIVNFYQLSLTRLQAFDLPVFLTPVFMLTTLTPLILTRAMVAIVRMGECLNGWASINSLALFYNPKDFASFHSGCQNSGTNPDLAFAGVDSDSRLPDRRILEKFPKSQHLLIVNHTTKVCFVVPRMPVKRWNFREAKWSHYIILTKKFAKTLLPRDSPDMDQDSCNVISSAAKRSVLRGRRNNHVPCWDAECENLYRVFLRSDGNNSSRAAAVLLTRLDRKRRDRWSEVFQSIEFLHSTRKTWSILNNLTGGSRHSFRHFRVLADSIAS